MGRLGKYWKSFSHKKKSYDALEATSSTEIKAHLSVCVQHIIKLILCRLKQFAACAHFFLGLGHNSGLERSQRIGLKRQTAVTQPLIGANL